MAGVRFFATYGYFDLTCVKVLQSLVSPSSLTLDADITESATFRFVCPSGDGTPKQFRSALDNWDAATATFLKIHPVHVETSPIAARWLFARKIAESLPGAFVFCGFGTCELLIMLGGRDLPRLLKLVTAMREPDTRNPLNTLRRFLKNKAPLFAGTSTFPLVSYDRVHRVRGYDRLRGKVEPVISISCDPESELVISSKYESQLRVLNVYGRHDLVLTWPEPISTSEFVRTVNIMRTEWARAGYVVHTTSYLETKRERPSTCPEGKRKSKRSAGPTRIDTELHKKTVQLIQPPGLRAAITDVALRLNACSQDWKIGTHYADMLNTFEYLQQTAVKVTEKKAAEHDRNRDRFELTHIVDLARRAILQRHAGLETRPELLAYAESPLLCDIRLLVAAASCIPYFIFDNLIPGRKAEETWPGYVLFFGDSPRWLRQNILALPASSIFDPVGEWWKITHEAAHAVFKILELEGRLGDRFGKIERYIQQYIHPGVKATRMISEVFANWFDWNYIFQRDTALYVSTIWTSWLDQPAVFSNAPQYLSRSVAILLASDLETFAEMRQRGRRKTYLLPYLQRKLEWVGRIISRSSAGKDFMSQIDQTRKDMIYDLLERLHPLLFWLENFFESDCDIVGLKKRLCPPYRSLKEHSKMLSNGQIVLQRIPNPCQLHLRLLSKLPPADTAIATDAAFVFTLANSMATRNDGSIAK